jgi:glycosyltransferase involved in cell wall biosynthesis
LEPDRQQPRLSAVVIAHDEERNLPDCLAALRFADEIVVLLDRCTDGSRDIAERLADRVVEGAWPLESDRRVLAEGCATGDWVLEVDADERVSPALAEEIRRTVASSRHDYHLIPFDNYVGATRIRHGWGAYMGVGSKACLFRRGIRDIEPAWLHSRIAYRGERGPSLGNRMAHYADDDIADLIARFNRYTTARACDLRRSGEHGSLWRNLGRFFARFYKCYVRKKGYREGHWGLLIAVLAGLFPLVSYIKAELEAELEEELGNGPAAAETGPAAPPALDRQP